MKVYVAIYEHKYGNDIRVFNDMKKAEEWRVEIADEWFDDVFRGDLKKPLDTNEMAGLYWSNVQDEWFNIEESEVE